MSVRIAYLSGPAQADVVYSEIFENAVSSFYGSSYLGQFFRLCQECDATGYVITNRPTAYERIYKGRFTLENIPNPQYTGVLYHISMVLWFSKLLPRLLRYKPHVIILTLNYQYWFMLLPLLLLGTRIIPSFHETLWPKSANPKRHVVFLWMLNRLILLRSAAIVVASADIARQVRTLVSPKVEILIHLPTYPRNQFDHIGPLGFSLPFRVLFAGRIHETKGIYDLLEVAKKLNIMRPGEFHFDICGDGSELRNLRQRITDLALESVVTCHGFCPPETLNRVISTSHVWIVPTRSTFAAGYEMVCAEAILARRLLVASSACPALEDLRTAAIEVAADNVSEYCAAIVRLRDDAVLRASKEAACDQLRERFFDERNSWKTKVLNILRGNLHRPDDGHFGSACA